MTYQVIPESAQRAAEDAYRETLTELRLTEGGGFKVGSQVKRSLAAAVEAAAPYLAAQALDDAVAAFPLETITAPDNAIVWMARRAEQIRSQA